MCTLHLSHITHPFLPPHPKSRISSVCWGGVGGDYTNTGGWTSRWAARISNLPVIVPSLRLTGVPTRHHFVLKKMWSDTLLCKTHPQQVQHPCKTFQTWQDKHPITDPVYFHGYNRSRQEGSPCRQINCDPSWFPSNGNPAEKFDTYFKSTVSYIFMTGFTAV